MLYRETILITLLVLTYFVLWKYKKISQRRQSGIDPEVLRQATSSIQKYMGRFATVLTLYLITIIIMHSVNVQFYSFFARSSMIDTLINDFIGFAIGLFGLSICLYAQIKMGNSWRVGIDEENTTDLITTGLYRFIRNPTYLGLFLLIIGLWLIWPTWTVFLFGFSFSLFFEIQVSCEEEYLLKIHGKTYQQYKLKTKKYIPFLY